MHVKNLTFRYKRASKITLDNVSLNLKSNKLNALVGVNGSGKTTLLDCLTNVFKSEYTEKSFPNISDVLYMTQSMFLSPMIKGKDMARFILRLDNRVSSNAYEVFYESMLSDREKLLFQHLWNLKLGHMSIGERKWFFVTLLCKINKDLYIFDEPTTSVDPSTRLKLLKKFTQIVEGQKTCLITTHQLHDLLHIDCHLILLYQGRVLFEGDFIAWLEQNKTTNPDVAFERELERV